MKKLYILLILCVVLFAALIIILHPSEKAYAEQDEELSASIVLIGCNSKHQKTTRGLGTVFYHYYNQKYIFDDEVSQKSLSSYLTANNVSDISVIDTQYNNLRVDHINGNYIAIPSSGNYPVGTVNIFNPYYSISYVSGGAGMSSNCPNMFYKTENVTLDLYWASKSRKFFCGWYTEPEYINRKTTVDTSTVTENLVFYACFSTLYTTNAYKYDYTQFNKTETLVQEIKFGLNSTLNRYIFDSQLHQLFLDSRKENIYYLSTSGALVSILTSPEECYASAEHGAPTRIIFTDTIYEITYHLNGGSFTENSLRFYTDISEFSLIKAPVRNNYEFLGWHFDEACLDYFEYNDSFVIRNFDLYPLWSEIVSINVCHLYISNYNLVEDIVDTVTYYYIPAYTRYVFSDNFLDKKEQFNKPLTVLDAQNRPLTVFMQYGKYCAVGNGAPVKIELKNTYYSITYHLDGGTFNTSAVYYYENKSDLNNIADPIKHSHFFLGWHLDSEFNEVLFPLPTNFECRNLELYALWTEIFAVPLYHDYIENGQLQHVLVANIDCYYIEYHIRYIYSSNLKTIADEIKKPYFAYDQQNSAINITSHNGQYVSFGDKKPTKIIIKNNYYSINYHVDGGQLNNAVNYYESVSDLQSLPNPVKPSYHFLGWHLDSALEETLEPIPQSFVCRDLNLYAKWTELFNIPVYHDYVENGELKHVLINNITCYFLDYHIRYIYSDVLKDIKADINEPINAYDDQNNAINFTMHNGQFVSFGNTKPALLVLKRSFYSIEYILNGGTMSNYVNFYETIEDLKSLPTPFKKSYHFMGWHVDQELEEELLPIRQSFVLQNLKLYAKWTELFSVPLYHDYLDNGELFNVFINNIDCYYIEYHNRYIYSDTLKTAVQDINKPLLAFDINDNPINITTHNGQYVSFGESKPNKLTLKESFYSIEYHLNGGNMDSYVNYYVNAEDLKLLPTPTKESYQFLGWHIDEELTQELLPIRQNFIMQDLVLYARWTEIFTIPIFHIWTDYYNAFTEHIDSVDVYEIPDIYQYIYSTNIVDKKSVLNKPLKVLDIEGNQINITMNSGRYISSNIRKPNKIVIKEDFYSITYMIDNDQLSGNHINYYSDKSQLFNSLPTPSLDNFHFLGWATSENLDEVSFGSSDFKYEDITLYPNFKEKRPIKVYLFDSSSTKGDYVFIGDSYYYEYLDDFYCYGNLQNITDQIGYYLNEYNVTSFNVVDENNNKLNCLTNNGYCLSVKDELTPSAINIYKHYSVRFYVNGIAAHVSHGNIGSTIETPDFITGFIGKNYDALDVGNYIIGNRFAIYLMKGWSYTDSSDKTWFDKSKVSLISDWQIKEGDPYVKDVYAYMTFYCKLSEKNSNINYDEYLRETKGIITKTSSYSIDELLTEHVTEVSAGSARNVGEKLFESVKSGGQNIGDFIKNIGSSTSTGISGLWHDVLGKVVSISILVLSFVIVLAIIISLFKIQKKPS